MTYAIENEFIVAPGKFEGQPTFVPHLWDQVLRGFATDEFEDGQLVARIDIEPSDVEQFPMLENVLYVDLWEMESGFVTHEMALGCDQCAAAMINGVFCHETGCPNS